MKCPACGNPLKKTTVAGVELDLCDGGCGGVWFDRFELEKLDEPHEPGEDWFRKIRRDPQAEIDGSRRRKCPQCGDVYMMRHFFSVKAEVQVDECPGCAGYWLDHGELSKIRRLFDSEEARNKAADEYLSELFDDKMKEMRARSESRLGMARKFANILRFLCPSWYVRGKQEWGAH
ncbi:MAG: zf-TFIIB domain-containing protein [Candidatus Eisenbacteria bacterium]